MLRLLANAHLTPRQLHHHSQNRAVVNTATEVAPTNYCVLIAIPTRHHR